MAKVPDVLSGFPSISNIGYEKDIEAATADTRNTLIAANLAAGAIAATGDKKYAENPDEAIAVFDLYFKALQARR